MQRFTHWKYHISGEITDLMPNTVLSAKNDER